MKINERKHKMYFFVVAMFFLAIASPTQVYGFANSRILDGQEVLSENLGILGQRNTRDLSNPPNNLAVFNPDGTIERVWIPSTAFIDPSIVMPFQVSSFEVITLNESIRSPNQSVIITILGDGFTSDEQDLFVRQAEAVSYGILNTHPFDIFSDIVTVYAVKVISNESGASRDPNWDSPSVDNYFGSTFWFDANENVYGSGTQRLLYTRNDSRVQEVLNAHTPNFDVVIVLVNSTTHGGGGGAFAVSAITDSVAPIVVHELGHSIGGLADEYWWVEGNGGGPGEHRANRTQIYDPEIIRWRHWLDVGGAYFGNNAYHGIFPFAEVGVNDWFRPHQYCMMRSIVNPFCGVCSSELTRRMAYFSGEIFHNKSELTYFVIPYGTTRILPYAFWGSEYLTSITIPASVTTIERFAFLHNTNLERIINLANIPQDITGSDRFFGVDRSTVEVTIPHGTRQAYINAGWDGFNFRYPHTIAVVPGSFDNIGAILRRMNIDFTTLTAANFANYAMNYDVVFINCSTTPATQAIRDFVAQGGTLYASDLSSAALSLAFPNHVAFASTGTHNFASEISNAGLATHMGSTQMNVVGLWNAFATRVPENATIYLTHPTMGFPAAFSFPYGEGRVFFTSFHNSAQATRPIERFLEYLVLSMRHVDNVDTLRAMATAAGYTFEGAIFESLMPGTSSYAFSYVPTPAHDFWLIMDPAIGNFTLHLIDPLGRVYTSDGLGIVNPIAQPILPTAIPITSALYFEYGDVGFHSHHDEHERMLTLNQLPFVEPIISEMTNYIGERVAQNFGTVDSSNMVVVSRGQEGLSVTNPISGEWRFIITSNNTDSAVFVLGIAERMGAVAPDHGATTDIDGYTIIRTAAELNAIRQNLNGQFRLRSDIDLSTFNNWQPINNFTGSFDGNGHTISGLRINRPSETNIGLFGSINNATIRNLTVELGGDIIGHSRVGAIAGSSTHSTTSGSTLQNNVVIGNGATLRANALLGYVGGLIGYAGDNTVLTDNHISNLRAVTTGVSNYTGGIVGAARNTQLTRNQVHNVHSEAFSYAGGIAGVVYGLSTATTTRGSMVIDAYVSANSSVHSRGPYAGGAFGAIYEHAQATNVMTHATVTSAATNSYAGGFAGVIYNSAIVRQSAAYGNVTAQRYTGGFAGAIYNNAHVINSYSRGNVQGTTEVGGFIGTFYDLATIENTFTTSSVTGNGTRTGSFAGEHIGTLQRYAGTNFFNSQTSNNPRAHGTGGIGSGAGGALSELSRPQGLTTEQMSSPISFNGWDFTNIWRINESGGFPYFIAFFQ